MNCQKRPNAYSWIHAQNMIDSFYARRSSAAYTANDATEGMTFMIRQRLEDLISSPLPEQEADSQFIWYMLENEKEFSGLALTRRKDFLHLARYLACIYPEYYSKGQLRPVTVDGENVNLDELIKAMFSSVLTEKTSFLQTSAKSVPATTKTVLSSMDENFCQMENSWQMRNCQNLGMCIRYDLVMRL